MTVTVPANAAEEARTKVAASARRRTANPRRSIETSPSGDGPRGRALYGTTLWARILAEASTGRDSWLPSAAVRHISLEWADSTSRARPEGPPKGRPMATSMRLIKKYPNRRLYDTQTSTYITLTDVKQ